MIIKLAFCPFRGSRNPDPETQCGSLILPEILIYFSIYAQNWYYPRPVGFLLYGVDYSRPQIRIRAAVATVPENPDSD
jgi:hypothetical protein